MARSPDKTALVCGGERVGHRELDARANRLAHTLRRRGVERGDRVIVFLDNSVEAVVGANKEPGLPGWQRFERARPC